MYEGRSVAAAPQRMPVRMRFDYNATVATTIILLIVAGLPNGFEFRVRKASSPVGASVWGKSKQVERS
jgi:hypothetical protein